MTTDMLLSIPPNSHRELLWDPLLTPEEAGRVIGYEGDTLITWRDREPGRGPRAFKSARIVRYRRSDLDLWLARETGALPFTTLTFCEEDRPLSTREVVAYLRMPSIPTWRSSEPERCPPGFRAGGRGRVRYLLSAVNRWVEENLEPL